MNELLKETRTGLKSIHLLLNDRLIFPKDRRLKMILHFCKLIIGMTEQPKIMKFATTQCSEILNACCETQTDILLFSNTASQTEAVSSDFEQQETKLSVATQCNEILSACYETQTDILVLANTASQTEELGSTSEQKETKLTEVAQFFDILTTCHKTQTDVVEFANTASQTEVFSSTSEQKETNHAEVTQCSGILTICHETQTDVVEYANTASQTEELRSTPNHQQKQTSATEWFENLGTENQTQTRVLELSNTASQTEESSSTTSKNAVVPPVVATTENGKSYRKKHQQEEIHEEARPTSCGPIRRLVVKGLPKGESCNNLIQNLAVHGEILSCKPLVTATQKITSHYLIEVHVDQLPFFSNLKTLMGFKVNIQRFRVRKPKWQNNYLLETVVLPLLKALIPNLSSRPFTRRSENRKYQTTIHDQNQELLCV